MKSKEELKLRLALLTECIAAKNIEYMEFKDKPLSEQVDKVIQINFLSGQIDILKWMLNE